MRYTFVYDFRFTVIKTTIQNCQFAINTFMAAPKWGTDNISFSLILRCYTIRSSIQV